MGIIPVFKQKIIAYIKNYRAVMISRCDKDDLNYSKQIILNTSLTQEEKYKIKRLWGDIIPNIDDGYLSYRIFKQIYGFDERFIPARYFYPHIMWRLNNKDATSTLSHKGMLPIYFRNILQPKIVINCINRNIFDSQNHPISIGDAIKYMLSRGGQVIVKPSIDSSSGKNVRIIDIDKDGNSIVDLLKLYGDNYVVQELVEQSQTTAQLNPTSLQTLRINTLFINGHCTAVKNVLRCGGVGKIVDNLNAGGFMVGIHSDGRLNEFGYSLDGKVHTHTNGHRLKDIVLPNFNNVIKTAIQAHIENIPNCSLVGWDFSLNKNNEAVLIEANLKNPSCFGTQLCGSPMFGERTKEVIDYVKDHIDNSRLFY